MKKNIIEKTLNIFAWFIFAIAIVTAILSVFSSFSGEKNGKDIFGVKFLIVASDSMSKSPLSKNEPIFFDAGDIVIIKSAVKNQEYKAGDVISFLSRNPDSYGKTLTHKIREVNYSSSGQLISYTTYGINTGVNDRAVVSQDTIIGEYVGKIPKVGTLFSYLKTPLGYYLSILTPSVLLIIFFSIKIGRFLGKKEAINEQKESQTYVLPTNEEFVQLGERVKLLEEKFMLNSSISLEKEEISNDLEQPEIIVQEDRNLTQEETLSQIFADKTKANRSFAQKVLSLDGCVQRYFNTLHNQLLSYKKIKTRITFRHVTYKKGKKLLAKITVIGKTLKLHLNLNVNQFNKNVFFQNDMSNLKAYKEVPFTVKVKSARAEKNAVKLISILMEQNDILKNENYILIDAIAVLKSSNLLTDKEQPTEVDKEVAITENQLTEKAKLIINSKKITFAEKLFNLDAQTQQFFNTIHNHLISYRKIKGRLSNKCVSYRKGRNLVAKITVRGKTLKLHLNLNVDDFNKNAFFQRDMSNVKAYAEVPFTVKVKSARGEKNAVKLIDALMEKNQTIINPKHEQINGIDLLKEKYDKNK